MFSPIVTHPAELRRKIGEYLTKRHSQTDIARLKIALDELRYLVVPTNIKPFRDALQAEYGSDIRIVHERGIQEAYSRLTEPLLIGSAVSSRGGEALIIREIKDFRSIITLYLRRRSDFRAAALLSRPPEGCASQRAESNV